MFSFSRLGRSSGCSSGLIVCIVYLRNSLLPSFYRTNSPCRCQLTRLWEIRADMANCARCSE